MQSDPLNEKSRNVIILCAMGKMNRTRKKMYRNFVTKKTNKFQTYLDLGARKEGLIDTDILNISLLYRINELTCCNDNVESILTSKD